MKKWHPLVTPKVWCWDTFYKPSNRQLSIGLSCDLRTICTNLQKFQGHLMSFSSQESSISFSCLFTWRSAVQYESSWQWQDGLFPWADSNPSEAVQSARYWGRSKLGITSEVASGNETLDPTPVNIRELWMASSYSLIIIRNQFCQKLEQHLSLKTKYNKREDNPQVRLAPSPGRKAEFLLQSPSPLTCEHIAAALVWAVSATATFCWLAAEMQWHLHDQPNAPQNHLTGWFLANAQSSWLSQVFRPPWVPLAFPTAMIGSQVHLAIEVPLWKQLRDLPRPFHHVQKLQRFLTWQVEEFWGEVHWYLLEKLLPEVLATSVSSLKVGDLQLDVWSKLPKPKCHLAKLPLPE